MIFLSMGVVGYSVCASTMCCRRVCAFFSDMRAEEATVPRSHVVCWCIEE